MAIRVLVVLAALLPACSDTWLTGKWRGELAETNETLFLALEQDGERVFGNGRFGETADINADGTVKDEEIELKIFIDPEARYEAHTQGENMMTGTWFHRGTNQTVDARATVT